MTNKNTACPIDGSWQSWVLLLLFIITGGPVLPIGDVTIVIWDRPYVMWVIKRKWERSIRLVGQACENGCMPNEAFQADNCIDIKQTDEASLTNYLGIQAAIRVE